MSHSPDPNQNIEQQPKKPEVNEVAAIVYGVLYGDPGLDRTGVAKEIIRKVENLVSKQVSEARIKAIASYKEVNELLENEVRIDENQRRLDKIIEFENRKPVPGELTTASFGSAGAAMETSGWKHAFENRIAELKQTPPTPNGDEQGGLARLSDEKYATDVNIRRLYDTI